MIRVFKSALVIIQKDVIWLGSEHKEYAKRHSVGLKTEKDEERRDEAERPSYFADVQRMYSAQSGLHSMRRRFYALRVCTQAQIFFYYNGRSDRKVHEKCDQSHKLPSHALTDRQTFYPSIKLLSFILRFVHLINIVARWKDG